MSGLITVFVDTSVLLCAEDGADTTKQQQAREWLGQLWRRRCGRTCTQVLNEFYGLATRQLQPPMPAGDARAEVRRYQHWKPLHTDQQMVETAWAVESRFGLTWWNALVVAAAQHQGCRWLLSDSLPHSLQIDSVQIINPFLMGPSLLESPSLSPDSAATAV